jgi:hypothetical protein
MEPLLKTFLSYLLAGVGVFLVSITLVYIQIRPKYVDPKVPGPMRHFFLGITFSEASELLDGEIFNGDKWPKLTLALSRRFDFQTWGGPTINLGGFGGAFFNVVSPACLQYILRDNFENYVKGERLTKSFRELFGKVAFTTDGEAWKFHRNIVVVTLNRDTVRYGADVLLEKLEQIEGLLDKKSDAEEIFDFQDLSYRMILESLSRLALALI